MGGPARTEHRRDVIGRLGRGVVQLGGRVASFVLPWLAVSGALAPFSVSRCVLGEPLRSLAQLMPKTSDGSVV